MFVLVRTDGKYVTWPGSLRSYSRSIKSARIFPTAEAADGDRCVVNESVRPVTDRLRHQLERCRP